MFVSYFFLFLVWETGNYVYTCVFCVIMDFTFSFWVSEFRFCVSFFV